MLVALLRFIWVRLLRRVGSMKWEQMFTIREMVRKMSMYLLIQTRMTESLFDLITLIIQIKIRKDKLSFMKIFKFKIIQMGGAVFMFQFVIVMY